MTTIDNPKNNFTAKQLMDAVDKLWDAGVPTYADTMKFKQRQIDQEAWCKENCSGNFKKATMVTRIENKTLYFDGWEFSENDDVVAFKLMFG